MTLNNTPFGGKKRHSMFRDDIWNIKYLSKFKWDHLTEKFTYDERVRYQRLKAEMSRAKRETNFFIEKADLSRKIHSMEKRKKKQIGKIEGSDQ
jgi:ESF2/ABP1 family protein